jgi:hyperosmotically inducible periplasmic protein
MKTSLQLSILTASALIMASPAWAQPAQAEKADTGFSRQDATGMGERREDPSRIDPGNPSLNVRDLDRTNVTPLDQGNSPEDTAATAAIRQDIMAREGLSIEARNVKVITRDGKVTLGGRVKTAEEKSFIAETARNRLGAENVSDQIEVRK